MLNFLKGVFSDGDQPSFSRVASGVLVAFACGWITALLYHDHKLPDPAELLALGAFVTLFYGVNRGTQSLGK